MKDSGLLLIDVDTGEPVVLRDGDRLTVTSTVVDGVPIPDGMRLEDGELVGVSFCRVIRGGD